MAYEINTRDGKRIVYTGDLRFHGHIHEREQSEEFLNRINPNPDIFITEGTRINDNDLVSEQDVYHRIVNLLREDDNLSEKLILATFPWKSISRFLTLYQIAKTINRTLVIQPKLAYTIYHLKTFESLKIDGLLKDNRIKIYLPRKYSMLYSQDDYKSAKYYISPNVEWSKDEQIELYSSIYEEDIMKKAYEINKNPNKYIVHLNFYQLNELIDLQPPKGSYFFNLKTEPFDEEGELEEKVLMNWINKFGLEYKKDKFHASGHAPGVQILDMINRVKPEKIIPVHTEINEIFSENFKNTIIPKKGVPYRF
ncbi:MAG: MBL fold metallo-hydrolase RNA specificity domain-containing protein [Candidatus Lokiarchaeota archaeon]